MPGSYRRLRLLSTSVMRDSRILLRRDMTVGLMSTSAGRGFSGNVTNKFHTNAIKPHSLFADRWHQRRSETARGFTAVTFPSSSIENRSTSLQVAENIAGFHSSPLSCFAAEAEEAKATEDATTSSTTAAASNETSPDGAEDDEEPSATDISYDFAPPAPLSQASQDKVQAIFDKVLWLDMIEVHLLTQIVNEQMGISWRETEQRRMGGGGVQKAASGGAAETEAVEEKTIFDLKLVGFDAKAKIKVIKEVRTIAGLGLKEAKEMVEGSPKVIQKELKLEKAEELKAQLEAVGAQVELV